MNTKKIAFIAIIIVLVLGGFYLQKQQSLSPSNLNSNKAVPTNTICDIAQNVTEGPYYISGTAKLSNNDLNTTNLAGTKIKISGHVYAGTDNTNPIANAKIELWQADNTGKYHPASNGNAASFNKDELGLRGYILSDNTGYYEFTSIYPGYYEGRARHIHAKVTAEGHADQITQLMFLPKEGDRVSIENDHIAQTLPTCNMLKMIKSGEHETGYYDFRLRM